MKFAVRIAAPVLACALMGAWLFLGAAPGGAATSTITVPATVTASTWTAASSTPTVADGSFGGVSCANADFCVGVGNQTVGGLTEPLVEQWTGSAWTLVTTPSLTGEGGFSAVSCATATSCMAVGFSGSNTLTEQWNGSAWTIVPSPDLTGFTNNGLTGVSCPSTTFCMTVGTASTPTYAPMAASWNGTAWTLQTVPVTGLGSGPQFNAVSCTSSTVCMGVGNSDGGNSSMAEQWNGTAWSVVSTPNPDGQTNVDLLGVSCVGTAWCTAVGYGFGTTAYQTLVEQWNGSNWSIVASPNAGTANTVSNQLYGIDCFSMTSCSAVGFSSPTAGNDTEALAWNGTTWTIATTPNQSGATSTSLIGVSCVTDWACVGLGSSTLAGSYRVRGQRTDRPLRLPLRGVRRRRVLLRERRTIPRLHGRVAAQPADRRHGRHARR